MDDLIRDFVVETLESLDHLDAELLRFEQNPGDSRIVAQIYRLLHTVKGTCGFLSLQRLERLSHAAEDLIGRFRDGALATRDDVSLTLAALDRVKAIVVTIAETGREPDGVDNELIALLSAASAKGCADGMASGAEAAEGPDDADDLLVEPDLPVPAPSADPSLVRQNVRVTVERLDHLMTMVSELVLVRNQLLELARREDAGGFKLPLQRLSHITAELQDGVMRTRMQSIGASWSKISRTVRDLSAELGKDIRLETLGADTEIDRQILEVLKDCIVHMVRNAADHGIELPRERIAAGKTAHGTIRLRAGQEGSQIVLEVSDDGRGLDLERIRAKAYGAGIVDDDKLQRMSDQEIARLIFAAGFSTAGSITNLSGRGVGLDAVRTSIEAVGGVVDVTTRPGQGTSIILRMPLTLAVAGVLIVEAADQLYALPQVVIAELVRPQATGDVRLDSLGGASVLRMRERLIPVIDLAQTLTLASSRDAAGGFIVICDVGHKRFGLRVDAVHQTEDVVVKPVSTRLRHIPYYSGATILGDGSVILILEPTGFAGHVQGAQDADVEAPESRSNAPEELTSLLVFRAGDRRCRVVPLALVSRLEELDAQRIEMLGTQPVVQYNGALLPLVLADPSMRLRQDGLQSVLKFRHEGRRVGLAVDEIVDVVEARLQVDLMHDLPGYIGSAIVAGETMPVLDVAGLFGDQVSPPAEDDGQNRLLLVEGSDFFRALLVPLLTGAGYEVQVARTPEAARTMVSQQVFALAVLDLDRPEGLALAAEWAASHPPAVGHMCGLATRPVPQLAAAARHAGIRTLIGKFDRRGLLSALSGPVTPAVGAAA